MAKTHTVKSSFDKQTRYNWGKYDAMTQKANGGRMRDENWLDRHFDQSYAAGYREAKYADVVVA